jgi:hypothetical protein
MTTAAGDHQAGCKNCPLPVFWSLDMRRWLHDGPRVRYCPANFTPEHNPTTEAEPDREV